MSLQYRVQLFATFLVVGHFGTCTCTNKVDSKLKAVLESIGKADIVVSFAQKGTTVLKQVKSSRSGDRILQANQLVAALEENLEKSQAGVIESLSTRSSGAGTYKYFKRYWTSNSLFVKEADLTTVNTIASNPDVVKIEIEPILKLGPKKSNISGKGEPPIYEPPGWSIERIKAPEAWAALGNNTGSGVVVGIIDTGVRSTHRQIKGKMRQDYNWFDPVNGSTTPFDDNGHGSHVTGIIVGWPQYAVAPGATYIVCKACTSDGNCPLEFVSACLAFMACPTLPDGSNRDCSKAPRVINVSIGDFHGSEANKEDLESVRAVGIIPVFGIGNTGPECNTTEAPGELASVIGVGFTDGGDNIHPDSSVGPAYDGRIKPDLVAPGQNIYSADNVNDEQLLSTRGSSNAAPHVTGVVALLLVRNPELTFDEAYSLLTENTDREGITVKFKKDCPGQPDDVIPNNFMGYGLLNALKVVEAQTKLLEKNKM